MDLYGENQLHKVFALRILRKEFLAGLFLPYIADFLKWHRIYAFCDIRVDIQ